MSCGVELPTAEARGIVPDRGWTGEVTPVRIEGSNLYPLITSRLGTLTCRKTMRSTGRGASANDGGASAWGCGSRES